LSLGDKNDPNFLHQNTKNALLSTKTKVRFLNEARLTAQAEYFTQKSLPQQVAE